MRYKNSDAVPIKDDLVEVVRCNACEHYKFLRDDKWLGIIGTCACFAEDCVKPDDFCSYGERREQ